MTDSSSETRRFFGVACRPYRSQFPDEMELLQSQAANESEAWIGYALGSTFTNLRCALHTVSGGTKYLWYSGITGVSPGADGRSVHVSSIEGDVQLGVNPRRAADVAAGFRALTAKARSAAGEALAARIINSGSQALLSKHQAALLALHPDIIGRVKLRAGSLRPVSSDCYAFYELVRRIANIADQASNRRVSHNAAVAEVARLLNR